MEIYIQCADCGEDIEVFNLEIRAGKAFIKITSCPCSAEELIDEARQEGYDTGFNDASY